MSQIELVACVCLRPHFHLRLPDGKTSVDFVTQAHGMDVVMGLVGLDHISTSDNQPTRHLILCRVPATADPDLLLQVLELNARLRAGTIQRSDFEGCPLQPLAA